MQFLVTRILRAIGPRDRTVVGRVIEAPDHEGCSGLLIKRGTAEVFKCQNYRHVGKYGTLMWIPIDEEVHETLSSLEVPFGVPGKEVTDGLRARHSG